MKKLLIYNLIFVLLFGLCGCSLVSEMNPTQVTKDSTNVFHLALDQDIKTPDIQEGGSDKIAANIYSRLLKLVDQGDGSKTVAGDLAESWDVSADGLSYTFHLKEGILFHNEEELEADDVLYTIDRMLSNYDQESSGDSVLKIRGAYDVLYGVSETIENKGVTITDKYTVVITLSEPWAPFLTELCDVSWSIYNRDAKDNGAYSIGTGPYIFEEWVAGDYVFLKVNDSYFGGKASIDGILYRIIPEKTRQLEAFTKGELDALTIEGDESLIRTYLEDETCSSYVVERAELNTYFYAMNQNLSPFTDVNVRRALQLALDRKAILTEAFSGQGKVLNGILPYGMIAYDQALPRIKCNLTEAKELIAEAGFTEGFSISICQTGLDEKESLVNQLTVTQLQACGINAAVKTMDAAAFYSSLTGGTMSMHLCCIQSESCDPDEILGKAFGVIENVRYSMNISDSSVLQRIENAVQISNLSQRVEEYNSIEEQLVSEDAAIIPMFQLYSYVLVNPRVDEFDSSSDCVYSFSFR